MNSSECHTPGLDHDLSVDIWAVGMLTLQLFLGYEEFPGGDSVLFTSQEDIDNYLNMIFVALTDEDRISEAAKHFIRKCLAYNREKRPTARDAFYHDWLQQPKEERKRLKQLEADNILSWKPQKVKFPIIEDLTAQSTWQGNKDAHVLRSSAMWPSTTLHFSS
jgi:Serine/threonine protein kinase